MSTVWLVMAAAMGLVHLGVIVAAVIGGPLALRWRRLLRLHALLALAVGAVFVMGADCPLTDWEKASLRAGGRVPYDGGFIEHYLVRPITGRAMSTSDQATVAAAWLVPTVASYWLLLRRSTRRGVEPATGHA